MTGDPVRVGVVGVGSMGRNHVRVYTELQEADLVGVADADPVLAREVADEYGTGVYTRGDLLAAVDAVSVAVPTQYHHEVAAACIDAGVDLLVEKPLAGDIAAAEDLAARADDAGVVLQVGHIERFNPGVTALADVLSDLEVLAVDAERLGPPPDRRIEDSAVMDLMVHDLDVICSLVDGAVEDVAAAGVEGNRHATATIRFDSGVVATCTASRLTQQKIRRLAITARECRVTVDYINQVVEIHRKSVPEFVETNGDVRYQHESIVERPAVHSGEPLKAELRSFLETSAANGEPEVTARDAIDVLRLARHIDAVARRETGPDAPEVVPWT